MYRPSFQSTLLLAAASNAAAAIKFGTHNLPSAAAAAAAAWCVVTCMAVFLPLRSLLLCHSMRHGSTHHPPHHSSYFQQNWLNQQDGAASSRPQLTLHCLLVRCLFWLSLLLLLPASRSSAPLAWRAPLLPLDMLNCSRIEYRYALAAALPVCCPAAWCDENHVEAHTVGELQIRHN
jgi:hypothetical protein